MEEKAQETPKESPEEKKARKKQEYLDRMAAGRAKAKAAKAMAETAKPDVIETTGDTAIPPKPVAESKIHWFSEVDMNQHGRPSSDFPAWYFDQHIAELNEDVRRIESNIDLDIYRGAHLLKMRKELAAKKSRLEAIQASKPKLQGADKDKVAKIARELGIQIGAAMFTREEKQRGLVDAHIEADRMVNPCIEVKSEIEADYYRRKGVKIVGGKVPRIQAEICWKTMVKALGEEPIANTERLRSMR